MGAGTRATGFLLPGRVGGCRWDFCRAGNGRNLGMVGRTVATEKKVFSDTRSPRPPRRFGLAGSAGRAGWKKNFFSVREGDTDYPISPPVHSSRSA